MVKVTHKRTMALLDRAKKTLGEARDEAECMIDAKFIDAAQSSFDELERTLGQLRDYVEADYGNSLPKFRAAKGRRRRTPGATQPKPKLPQ